ncbi:hypothetical protein DP782_23600 [Salmonella enterica subsp. enterica serovar Bovismorbificans]|nr:hypothetical protein [Salmonella enterica subsp. enterica serovar Bovismorbificans]CAH6618994.1 hypothetical protein AI2928V1_4450 [Escherichia coli]
MESIMTELMCLFGIGLFTGLVFICLKPEFLFSEKTLKVFPVIIVLLISFFFIVSFLRLSF